MGAPKHKEKSQVGSESLASKVRYAQYFTPSPVVDFMVNRFAPTASVHPRILDPGAGEGRLGIALCESMFLKGQQPTSTLIEIDEEVFASLNQDLRLSHLSDSCITLNEDFVSAGLRLRQEGVRFSHVIMNPPYFKLRRDNDTSVLLAKNGIDVTNIYAGFVWLSALLLEEDGQLVAIVPRSFCNGPYFKKFRTFLIENFSLDAIHVFDSRDSVFSDDKVLQENIIFRITKRPQRELVTITCSTDQGFSGVREVTYSAHDIISAKDSGYVISIPILPESQKLTGFFRCSLSDLGLGVSTGPVVDFRQKDAISDVSTVGCVPLLYPAHMSNGDITWPKEGLAKRGQYYQPKPGLWTMVDPTYLPADKSVSPADGYYVITRRFSSKEEKRRVYAAVVDATKYGASGVAFENHLNYFHRGKHGLDKELAYGLVAYLNSALLDTYFRTFSGHTQVNVSDLKSVPYPSLFQLRELGKEVLAGQIIPTAATDEEILEVSA